MDATTRWRALIRYVVAAGVAAAMTWFAFVARAPVPVFDWVDLGVHEAGHVITQPFGDLFRAMAGSLLQVAVPAGLALYFWLRQHDAAATGFCMAWAGTSAWDVSVYVADAPVQALPLIGGGHDWAYILGPQQFDALDRAASIAGFIELTAMVVAGAGVALALWPAARHLFGGSSRRPFGGPVVVGERPRSARHETARAAASHTAGDPWLAAAQLPFYQHAQRRDDR